MGCNNNWCLLLVLMLLFCDGGCGNSFGKCGGCNCCCDGMCQRNNDCGCQNGCC